ncbi:(Fe-S)-binding protein [Amycolatopsis sp.]|uniref:(Fe-S)-binding protein n=1 Tax=Amycolatopsis sp. TaxID=37632 RepID=UPI002C68E292|nr:(Fe-S)-binding protein [Amycolatopsis sp.]HVV12179.1 (Fe-S)-binding protein [Amycolatopsis sp.]
MLVRMILGVLITVAGLAFAGRRAWWLYRLMRSGQPLHGRTDNLRERATAQLVEVFGQRKLLKWSIPGLAHFFTFWGFVILASVYLEAYGSLFDETFSIPWIGHWAVLGFLQDFIAVAVLVSLITFAIIRLRNAPERKARASRFYGSHLGGAWLILLMIFNVVWTMFLFRGSSAAAGTFPYDSGAYVSLGLGKLIGLAGHGPAVVLEDVGLLLHIGVMLVFLVIVLHSKHLHIFLAPLNVTTKRMPDALGPLLPMESGGEPIDFEDADEDAIFGRGSIEDFTWKGILDFSTCTECGRCQSQCPAWNTGKPLSPKMVIMDLRDHLFDTAPYLIGGKDSAERPETPLVGEGGVIEPDVLWSCTTCGACVEQCPVDIEHVDHIVDMRRHQVLIESAFPTELGTLFKNLENKGNPWGQNNSERLDWAGDLGFEVPVCDGTLDDAVEYLFWVGCAGAFDDNARKTVRATAELLHLAGVSFAVLGDGETCTGDPARRSGNEFLFQMLAQETKETLNAVFEGREPAARKIVTTCPHCLNTLGREYPQLEGHYEVVHHTQLLNRLVRERKLVPVAPVPGTTVNGVGPVEGKPLTYHDPCYLGRHNKVYTPPRELVEATGATLTEMPRHADRSLCCGAGGARMWMEEKIGKRINLERVDEALGTEAGTIVTGCPFCKVMITDGLVQRQSENVGEDVTVRDVAQVLLESVTREGAPAPEPSAP